MGRWLLGGLIALNIALALLLGAVALGWRSGGPAFNAPMPSPHALRQALPKERSALVNQLLDQHKSEIRGAMRQQRLARRELYRALRQAEPGRDELDQRFAQLREAEQGTAVAVHDMLSELLSQLTPEERRQVAELFARRGHLGRDRRNERRAQEQEGERAGGAQDESRQSADKERSGGSADEGS